MRRHSKVELSVDFTELMTQTFIFNSQVGVLNVQKIFRITTNITYFGWYRIRNFKKYFIK